jgi:hypothetical protein
MRTKHQFEAAWVNPTPASHWDSISFDDGEQFPNSMNLFQVSIGQDGPKGVRRLLDTSMVRGGQFPPPQTFKVNRVLFTFSAATSDKMVYSFAESTVWEFRISDVRRLRNPLIALQQNREGIAPFRICQFCRAVWVMASTCPGCGARQFTLSSLAQSDERTGRQFFLDLPDDRALLIQPCESFVLGLMTHGLFVAEGPFRMWAHLEGFEDSILC